MRLPYLVHLPCTWQRHDRSRDDGDTISVTLISGLLWRIRLENVLAEEASTEPGRASKHWIEAKLEEHAHETSAIFHVSRRMVKAVREGRKINILNHVSFNRVVGDLLLNEDNVSLSDSVVEAGHAIWDESRGGRPDRTLVTFLQDESDEEVLNG
jgi:endonuclease YncB( thermonuclease family)